MAYKRKSPMPIIEGGTNAQAFSFVDGTTFFDGTRLGVTDPGTAGQVLTSNGAGVAPTYQNFASGSSGGSIVATAAGFSGSSRIVLSSTSSIIWITLGGTDIDTTQAANQVVVPVAGTLKNLYVIVSANTSTTNVTITLNKNSVNTALVATITALTTGTFFDTTHMVTVAAGDLLQWEVSQSTVGTITGSISMVFEG